MIRPRISDFLYSDLEFDVMLEDVKLFKQCAIAGFVYGFLTRDGKVDLERTQR